MMMIQSTSMTQRSIFNHIHSPRDQFNYKGLTYRVHSFQLRPGTHVPRADTIRAPKVRVDIHYGSRPERETSREAATAQEKEE